MWVAGTAPQDSILKFSRDGKLVWDFGHRPPKGSPPLKENNQQTDILASKGTFQPRRGRARNLHHQLEARAGLRHGHRRVQARLGRPRHAAKRNLQRPDPALQVDRARRRRKKRTSYPTCTSRRFPKTELVYVGERGQEPYRGVHHTRQVREGILRIAATRHHSGEDCGGLPPNTKMPPCGTTYKMVFSRDPAAEIHVRGRRHQQPRVDSRSPAAKLWASSARNGKYAGQLHWINAIGTDSKGNIYTGEVEQAKRIQKFSPVIAGNR